MNAAALRETGGPPVYAHVDEPAALAGVDNLLDVAALTRRTALIADFAAR